MDRNAWECRRRSPQSRGTLVALLIALGGCKPASSPTGEAPQAEKAAEAPTAPVAEAIPAPAPAAGEEAKWTGTYAPDAMWPTAIGTDVLVAVAAPTLDAAQVDAALRPIATHLRSLAGVDGVFVRAAPGSARLVVRLKPGGPRGRGAAELVRKQWTRAPDAQLGTPVILPIVRGARALGALQGVAVGGRPEATAWADGHGADLFLPSQQGPTATLRAHVVGAVRPMLSFRFQPAILASRGIGWTDVLTALRTWLRTDDGSRQNTDVASIRPGLHTIRLKRHWTPSDSPLPDAELDLLLDLNTEQGEPTREAQNGPSPAMFWVIDGPPILPPLTLTAHLKTVAEATGNVFAPTVQSLGAATRLVLTAPEDKPAPAPAVVQKSIQELRGRLDTIVAANAVSGLDGVPEPLDEDSRSGRRWTLWLSVATADAGSVLDNARGILEAQGWEVSALSPSSDTALCWMLDAWGSGGVLVSAEDAAQLAPVISALDGRAKAAQEKAGAKQGPTPTPRSFAYQRLRTSGLVDAGLTPDESAFLAGTLNGMQPLGWWHGTPVWSGWPVGDLAATVGMATLSWPRAGAKRGTGPGGAWQLQDLLQLPDRSAQIDRVRVNGQPALWMVPLAHADAPESVTGSFWRLVERSVDVRAHMRLDPLDVSQTVVVSEVQ